jgi:hypothetical protein
VTLTANSDHFSKRHNRLLTEPTGAYCRPGCTLNCYYLEFVFESPRRGPGGQSSASLRRSTGLIPDQSMWALWWTKWHWDKLFFYYWVFAPSLLFQLPSIFVGIFKATLSRRTNGRSLRTLTPFQMSRNAVRHVPLYFMYFKGPHSCAHSEAMKQFGLWGCAVCKRHRPRDYSRRVHHDNVRTCKLTDGCVYLELSIFRLYCSQSNNCTFNNVQPKFANLRRASYMLRPLHGHPQGGL